MADRKQADPVAQAIKEWGNAIVAALNKYLSKENGAEELPERTSDLSPSEGRDLLEE
jgi:hypothetical protein